MTSNIESNLAQSLPIIDVSALFGTDTDKRASVAAEIGEACRSSGFFYATGHRIDDDLLARLDFICRQFFALPVEEKMKIHMVQGGKALRGYFPPGGELTSGRPDLKEGIYFGTELDASDERVKEGVPLHGANLFPAYPDSMREIVLDYLQVNTRAAHALMEGIALSLGLDENYFRQNYTSDPTILFRIFHYPSDPTPGDSQKRWGVGEHTDYGLLTLLAQDDIGGLQVKTARGWIDAPHIPGTIVCNIGDMLDRLTGGVYRSTLHRVRNTSSRGRLSFPFFFDPGFNAEIHPLPESISEHVLKFDRSDRWDHVSIHDFSGTYGDYLLAKISKIFPELMRKVIVKVV